MLNCKKGNCAPLPVAFVVKSFFIGAHGQELSVPRVQPSLGSPGVVGQNPTQLEYTNITEYSQAACLAMTPTFPRLPHLSLETITWLYAHSLAFCRRINSLAWVLRSCGTLVLELATVFCNFALSCHQALFFWHVSSITKEHTFHADNAFSVYIFRFVIF